MSGRYLLDTNVVIPLFADDPQVVQVLANADELFLPAVVVGELYYGAWRSARPSHNLRHIDEFAAASVVLACDAHTARLYGDVKQKLRLKGRPLPENDLWIAATAIQYGLTLLTRDRHFQEIDDLRILSC